MSLQNSTCDLCSGTTVRRPDARTAIPLDWCTACGTGRVARDAAGGIAKADDYQEGYRTRKNGARFGPGIEAILRILHEGRAKWIANGCAKAGRALDIGCGRGDLGVALAKLGWTVDGVELNRAVATSEMPPGVRIRTGDFMELPLQGAYDLVCLFHVLEHLPDLDAAMTRIEALCTASADLVIEVPNANSYMHRLCGSAWLGRDLPNHVYQFQPRALVSYLRERGWDLVRTRQWSLEFGPFSVGQTLANAVVRKHHNALYRVLQDPNPSFALRLSALAQMPFVCLGGLAQPLLHVAAAPGMSGEIIRMHFKKSHEESR